MAASMKAAALFVITAVIFQAAQVNGDSMHYVGGGKANRWNPNVNLTEWSNQEQFYVGEWLYFGFDKNMYNVLEVNETSYEKCIETDFITNVTKGGRDVFELKEARNYYFISGRGFCFGGLKVEIDVKDAPIPPPFPSPSQKNVSPSNSPDAVFVLVLFSIFFLYLQF